MKKYFLFVIGCQQNKSDSERIASVLENLGYKKTTKKSRADLIIALACSVRQSAIDRLFGKGKVWNQIKKRRGLTTILTGCVLAEDKPKLKKYFDFIFDIKDLPELPKILNKISAQNSEFQIQNSKKYRESKRDYFTIDPKYSQSFSAYIPIMTGCNNFCSYCAVPLTRGREASRSFEEILKEIKRLASQGYKEIVLLGQNVNSYKSAIRDKGSAIRKSGTKNIDFSDLLKEINKIPGEFWIRFISNHPKDFPKKLIKTIAECQKVTPYINLPLQSGDDKILKKMNRHYTASNYLKLVADFKSTIPNICISADIIVGFPGETKKEFQNTANVMRKAKLDMAYIAQYSSRPGTVAAKEKDNVSREEKRERENILTEILAQTALANNQKYLDKEVVVLVESQDKRNKNIYYSRTKNFKLVQFKSPKNSIGQFIKINIQDATPWMLKGIFSN